MRILFYIIPIIGGLLFVLAIVLMFSSKARGWMLSKQVKSVKYMMDESKDDIHSISTDMADATKDGMETTARAIKKGFTAEDSMYCKYCGKQIDRDSVFCKHCGKEQ